jgi:hypothetical protein
VLTSELQDSGRIDVYARPTEPRSIGGVLDDGLRLWRDSLAKTWPLALLAQVVVSVPLLVLASKFPGVVWTPQTSPLSATSPADAQALLALFKSPATWLAYLAMLVLSVLCYTAIVLRIAGVAANLGVSLGGSLASALRLLPRLMMQILLFFIAIFVAGIALAILGAIGGAIAGGSKVATALIFIIIFLVAAFVFGRVFFATMALIIDDAGPAESIGISWRLTRGYWWRCAGLLLVLFVIGLVFTLVAGFLALAIGAVLGKGLMATGVSQLVSLLVNAVLGSLYPAVLIAILYDLKLRKEGGDLLGRVDALARQ